MPHKGTPIRYGQKQPRAESSATRGENLAAPHMIYMSARNFLRNAAVGMKSGFLEAPYK
jgi:hypothetical protein